MESCTFVVVGLAGAGKTTFCQRLYSWLSKDVLLKNGLNAHITSINLDPAVRNPKMPLTIDIRDTVDYHETMNKYGLGPNGATNTCLNLFWLQFKMPEKSKYTIIDTPGQIESITWSAPGDALLSLYPDALILYVIDSVLCNNKRVFMSNMLFAAAIKAKTSRPVLLVLTKSDLENTGDIKRWINDFEEFQKELKEDEPDLGSMALYFEEFYRNLETVCVSSYTGAGFNEFIEAVAKLLK